MARLDRAAARARIRRETRRSERSFFVPRGRVVGFGETLSARAMGSTCAKSDQSMEKPEEAEGAAPEKSKEKGENSPTPSTNGESPGKESSSPDKKKNFRQRRLSVDQQRDPSAKGAARHRRLSVYGQTAGQEQANPDVTVSLKSCGCKSVGGNIHPTQTRVSSRYVYDQICRRSARC